MTLADGNGLIARLIHGGLERRVGYAAVHADGGGLALEIDLCLLHAGDGGKRLLIMIIFTAFITGLINVIFFPGVALLGASGIAFMMILLSSFANSGSGEIPLTLICVAVLYLGTEVLNGLFAHNNISQMAHIIGGACGRAFGWLICNKKA